ncbi:hypothetical protein HYN59_04940 [Flavobacterium album]|uniref:Type IV secretion protein Rhs n=1 Tax=Flavobacterium album TaxID=2175091 RepID=A0A2S1QVQ8_9FLAO|nr:hypothetical protein [Flavobacterium album]AWH84502.1 hypothetical protein HYN59_04940 [Flavobacterium album]
MKLKYFSISFLLSLSVFTTSAQNIYSALHHDNPYDIKKDVPVSQVTTKTVFYNQSGTEVKKEVFSFNDKFKVTTEIRYDGTGKMTDRLTWMYDATGSKSIARKYERWMNALGYISETAYYEYDANGFQVKVIDKDQNGKVTSTTTIINDEKGYPIEVTVVTKNAVDYGKETAQYDIENNIVTITSFGPYGNILSTHSEKIDFSKYDDDEVVNENGDPVRSDGYEFTYVYDKNLNWIKQTRYRIVNGKQVKNAEFTRDIKYSKK